MLRKAGLLVLLCLFSNAENIKIEKFSLNDIKKCSESNKELLCKDNHGMFIYGNILFFEDNKTPICDAKLEKMYFFSERIYSIDNPKIDIKEDNNKTVIKQSYKTETLSTHKIGACKTDSKIIIKSENK